MASNSETRFEHIVLQNGHVPWIANTTMKVVELVTAHRVHGWSPEELAFQFPSLTLRQIHSVLAYYWDHQAELDAEMARGWLWQKTCGTVARPHQSWNASESAQAGRPHPQPPLRRGEGRQAHFRVPTTTRLPAGGPCIAANPPLSAPERGWG